MKTHITLSMLATALALTLVTFSSQASAFAIPHITQAQLESLHTGESRDDIITALGQPEDTASWMDGTRSMVYEFLDSMDGNQRVYVDLNGSNKLVSVEVLKP